MRPSRAIGWLKRTPGEYSIVDSAPETDVMGFGCVDSERLLMTLRNDGPPVLGIDLGGTKILAGVVNGSHRILGRAKRPTPAKEGGSAIVSAIMACVGDALESAELSRSEIVAASNAINPIVIGSRS